MLGRERAAVGVGSGDVDDPRPVDDDGGADDHVHDSDDRSDDHDGIDFDHDDGSPGTGG